MWGCGVLQPPPVSAQEPLPLWGRHPCCWGLTPIPQPSCYTIVITRLLLTAAYGLSRLLEKSGQRLAAAGTGPVRTLGDFWGAGRRVRGSPVEGRGQQPGEPACAAGPHDRQRPQAPWRFCRTRLGSLASTLPSEAALSSGRDWRRMRPVWRTRSSGRRAGSGRRAVSPPPTSWSSRPAAGRHISVCTCVPVCLRLGVRACAFMCVCACVCTRVRARSRCRRGADVRSAGEGGHRLGEASTWLRSGEPTAAAPA